MMKLNRLSKHFNGVHAVNDVSLHLQSKEVVALIGPNGAGKTTLFDIISGYLVPDAGTVELQGVDITGQAPHRLARMGLARAFQSLRLIHEVTVAENILLCFQRQRGESLFRALSRWTFRQQEEQHRQQTMDLARLVGLSECAGQTASTLSFGQQKLLSLACGLANGGSWLLLDEPVAGVNPVLARRLGEVLVRLAREGKGVIIIEHDLTFVKEYAERVIAMDAGRIVADGPADRVISSGTVSDAYLE